MFSKSLFLPALLAVAAASSPVAANAQSAPDKKAPRPATSRAQLKSEAKALALATEVTESINEQQMEIATRVHTGPARCEFQQQVHVKPVEGQPGQFQVNYKNAVYRMVPEETTSGAVRLQDKKAGVVWIQIPAKSMLMNSKVGQRLVDNCMHAEQQLAAEAPKQEQ